MAKKKQPEPSFEDALKRLEGVLDSLEHGNLNLEESVKAFEEGAGLVRFCHARLDDVERRVELLLKDENGRFFTRPFPEEEGEIAVSRFGDEVLKRNKPGGTGFQPVQSWSQEIPPPATGECFSSLGVVRRQNSRGLRALLPFAMDEIKCTRPQWSARPDLLLTSPRRRRSLTWRDISTASSATAPGPLINLGGFLAG